MRAIEVKGGHPVAANPSFLDAVLQHLPEKRQGLPELECGSNQELHEPVANNHTENWTIGSKPNANSFGSG